MFNRGDFVVCSSQDTFEPVYRATVWSLDMQSIVDFLDAHEIATIVKITDGIAANSLWLQILTPRGNLGTVHASNLSLLGTNR